MEEPDGQTFFDQRAHAAVGVAAILGKDATQLRQRVGFGRTQGDERFALAIGKPGNLHDGQDVQQGFFDFLALVWPGLLKGEFQSRYGIETLAERNVDAFAHERQGASRC